MEHSKIAGIVKLLKIQELKLDSNQTSSCQKAPKSGAKVCNIDSLCWRDVYYVSD